MPRQQQRKVTVEKRGTNPAAFRRLDNAPADTMALRDQIDDMLSAIERLEKRVSAIADVLPESMQEAAQDAAGLAPEGAAHGEGVEADWGDIAEELSQVIQTTEQATEQILDASESIDSIVGEVLEILADEVASSEAVEPIERIRGLTGQIFQAASFQDLTGQRISKVTKIVQAIDQRVGTLERCLSQGDGHVAVTKPSASAAISGASSASPLDPNDPHFNETSLLNGPSKSGEGISQEEIDQLF